MAIIAENELTAHVGPAAMTARSVTPNLCAFSAKSMHVKLITTQHSNQVTHTKERLDLRSLAEHRVDCFFVLFLNDILLKFHSLRHHTVLYCER